MEYLPPQPIPRNSNNRSLRNLLIGAFVVLLAVGAVTVVVLMKFFGVTQGPARTIQRHLNAINQGKIHMAYSDFTPEYRKQHTMDDFEKELEVFADQLPCRKWRLSEVDVIENKARLHGTLTGKDGSIFPMEYELIREKGEWRIQSYHWEPPGGQQQI